VQTQCFRRKTNQGSPITGKKDSELARDGHGIPQRGSFELRVPTETNGVAEYYRTWNLISKQKSGEGSEVPSPLSQEV